MKSLTKFVIFSFAALIVYTIISQAIALKTGGAELSTLTTCFFGAFGGEVLMCALIKIFKLKGGNKDGDSIHAPGDFVSNDNSDNGGGQNDDSGEG